MGLTCTCPDDGGGASWWYYAPDGYTELTTHNLRRCCSCKSAIRPRKGQRHSNPPRGRDKPRPGGLCAVFLRAQEPTHWIHRSCHGDEMPIAPWYMCERCADIYFSLTELGYCIKLGESMDDLLAEYQQNKSLHATSNHLTL